MIKKYIQISLFLAVCSAWNGLGAENSPLSAHDKPLQDLEIHDETPKQALENAIAQTEQQELDEDDQIFYKNLLWIGVGSLAIAGAVALVYVSFRNGGQGNQGNNNLEERLNLILREAGTDQDVVTGIENINRIINDANQDLRLRRILQQCVRHNRGGRWQYPISVPFENEELRDIPFATFRRAGELVQNNLFGDNAQRTMTDINRLIDRRMGHQPRY